MQFKKQLILKEEFYMKRLIFLFLVFSVILIFSACGSNEKTELDNKIIEDRALQTSIKNSSQDIMPQTNTHSVNVILNFHAVEGAVIYDQTYDEYGYPDCCYFHYKCESCGFVSNSNGSARDNIHTSYHCIECGNDQRVEISADKEWIDVPA